jgi:DNA (cytosine-5)-methyltransferase 1
LLEAFRADHPILFERRFGSIDLLAGGPPCQSFSLAGKRQKDNPRNRLFEAFVAVVKIVRPKVVLFENVLGITHPFIDEAGDKWHPWHEVCRAFRKAGYLPVPSLVNADDFGVPQSRQRFILVAVSDEIAQKVTGSALGKGGLAEALHRARTRYENSDNDRELLFRAETDIDRGFWPFPLFPLPNSLQAKDKVTVRSAIEDLLSIERDGTHVQGKYAARLDKLLKPPAGILAPVIPPNHGRRNHGERTRARFRLLQTLAAEGFRAKSMVEVAKKQGEALRLLVGKSLFVPLPDGTYVERDQAGTYEVLRLIDSLASAKNVQKCLNPEKPAGAQLSIPDDSVHWEAERVLTIREMARIQSFPDWFEFRSKETTGGSSRAFEVPQYTQVGNAVPPLLALAFGTAIKEFLAKVSQLE